MTCVRSDTRSDPAVTKPNEALRFIHKSELCWTLQSAHVILEEQLSDWKTGNSRQLKRSVRNESDWVGGAPQYRARDALWAEHECGSRCPRENPAPGRPRTGTGASPGQARHFSTLEQPADHGARLALETSVTRVSCRKSGASR